MFQLDKAIKKWYEQFKTTFIYDQSDLIELKDHLIIEIENLTNSGLSEEAFFIATNRLGDKENLNKEFSKVNHNNIWKYRLLWMAAGIVSFFVFNNFSVLISNLFSVSAVFFGLDNYLGFFNLIGRVISLIAIFSFIYFGLVKEKLFEKNYVGRITRTKFRRIILLISPLIILFILKISSSLFKPLLAGIVSPDIFMKLTFFNLYCEIALSSIFFFSITFFLWKQILLDRKQVE